MTQEDKDLLLKDLCARLPYGVKIQVNKEFIVELLNIEHYDFLEWAINGFSLGSDDVKPYLRPMSSMTEEEKNDLFQLMGRGTDIERIDFYISHHFDYCGLIPMGLALEALEGMYKID